MEENILIHNDKHISHPDRKLPGFFLSTHKEYMHIICIYTYNILQFIIKILQ